MGQNKSKFSMPTKLNTGPRGSIVNYIGKKVSSEPCPTCDTTFFKLQLVKRRAKCEKCKRQFCIGCTRPFYEVTEEQEK